MHRTVLDCFPVFLVSVHQLSVNSSFHFHFVLFKTLYFSSCIIDCLSKMTTRGSAVSRRKLQKPTPEAAPKRKNRKINLLQIQALEDPTMSVDVGDDVDVYGDDDFDDIPSVSDLLPTKNNLIQGQQSAYSVGRKLAPGRYGAVYQVLRKNDGRQFAAKLEVIDSGFNGLNNDYKLLKLASKQQCRQMPELFDRGKIEGHFKFIVMEMAGDNLWKLRHEFVEHRFSAPTTLKLALETLSAIEEFHSLGYVHRDIKPTNFLIQRGTSRVIIIDFGVCRSFRTADGDIRSPRDLCPFKGTTRYASLATHRETEQSPRDDLESWLYMVVELMTGSLPWSSYRKPDRETVKTLKEAARTTEGSWKLFKYCPRIEFRRILNYLDGLSYYSQPDYSFIRQMIQLSMKNNDIKPDELYDWEIASNQEDEGEGGKAEEKQEKNNNEDKNGTKQADAIADSLNGILNL